MLDPTLAAELGLEPEDAQEDVPVAAAPVASAEETYASIAELVRSNAQKAGRLTDLGAVEALIPPAEPDAPPLSLDEMVKDERYTDIQAAFASTGEVFLYSTSAITPDAARGKAEEDAVRARIAGRVRADSRDLVKLTPVAGLELPAGNEETGKPAFSLDAMLADERYPDIKSLVISTGAQYLFSETHVTRSYAEILGRAEANDPCATIAETVREAAHIYPRPTSVELFREPVFGIKSDELEGHVARLLSQPEYADIKKVVTSNGIVYLYSDRYMTEPHAQSLAEWYEVGRNENP